MSNDYKYAADDIETEKIIRKIENDEPRSEPHTVTRHTCKQCEFQTIAQPDTKKNHCKLIRLFGIDTSIFLHIIDDNEHTQRDALARSVIVILKRHWTVSSIKTVDDPEPLHLSNMTICPDRNRMIESRKKMTKLDRFRASLCVSIVP